MPFLNVMMEPMAGGYGARPQADGMDTGGLFCIPMGRIPDVEMTRVPLPAAHPVAARGARLRRPRAAARRGQRLGRGHARTASSIPAGLVLASAGKAVSQNNGLAGGYPGNTGLDAVARGINVHALLGSGSVPQSLDDLGEVSSSATVTRSPTRAGRGALHDLAGRRRVRRPAASRPGCGRLTTYESRRSHQRPRFRCTALSCGDGVVDGEGTAVLRHRLRDQRRQRSTCA